ncbi:MAG TPA: response regulator, partial [Gemmataceae bacterium]|nr:response regulator [Gemmataceae bacterium]
TPPASPPLRVLVVDDIPDTAVSLAEYLRAFGHDVSVAWNGEDALKAARESRPDAVVLDLGMPCMNGFEAARRFRADPAIGPAVLIALTGWGSDDDRRRTRAAGFDHHLVKPADPAGVLALLHETAWVS